MYIHNVCVYIYIYTYLIHTRFYRYICTHRISDLYYDATPGFCY
jgi:hypothetical protein